MNVRANPSVLHAPEPVTSPLPDFLSSYLQTRARRTAFLHFERAQFDDPLATKLMGHPYLPEGENWPHCRKCGRPMHHLFQFNFERSGLPALQGANLLTFFYCLGCSPNNHLDPGWQTILRTDLLSSSRRYPIPPFPDQSQQPGPILLLDEGPVIGRVRFGADLPSGYSDKEMRDKLGFSELTFLDAETARIGADRAAKVTLVEKSTGVSTETTMYLTPGTVLDRSTLHWFEPTHEVQNIDIRYLKPREDHLDQYLEYLQALRGNPGWHVVSKLGGWLDCEQDPRFDRCVCGSRLEHIATIKTGNGTPLVVLGEGALYLAACPASDCPYGELFWWVDWT